MYNLTQNNPSLVLKALKLYSLFRETTARIVV